MWKNIEAGGLLDSTTVSAGKGPFWQQNITPDRKSFIIQPKHIVFWSNKKFLKAHDLLLLLGGIGLDFVCGPCWSCFYLNCVLKEQFFKVLLTSSQNYSITTWVVDINSNSWHTLMEINKKIWNEWNKGKIWTKFHPY